MGFIRRALPAFFVLGVFLATDFVLIFGKRAPHTFLNITCIVIVTLLAMVMVGNVVNEYKKGKQVPGVTEKPAERAGGDGRRIQTDSAQAAPPKSTSSLVIRGVLAVVLLVPSLIATGLALRWFQGAAPGLLGYQPPQYVHVILFVGSFSIVSGLVAGIFFSPLRQLSRYELSRPESPSLGEVTERTSSQLILIRVNGYVDRLRAYQVMLDGVSVGQILDGEKKVYPLALGDHEISLSIDWCGSQIVRFSVSAAESKNLSCGSNLDGIRFLFFLWYATFGRRDYIWLR